jgi:hypothetical protein
MILVTYKSDVHPSPPECVRRNVSGPVPRSEAAPHLLTPRHRAIAPLTTANLAEPTDNSCENPELTEARRHEASRELRAEQPLTVRPSVHKRPFPGRRPPVASPQVSASRKLVPKLRVATQLWFWCTWWGAVTERNADLFASDSGSPGALSCGRAWVSARHPGRALLHSVEARLGPHRR